MVEPVRSLVVDDENGIRFFLEETLRRAGHVVTTAANGQEALDQLRDTSFDVVLLDLKLGGRVDGLKVLGAIRWRWPHTVVIILTAHASLDSALAAIREGVDGYLTKPVEPYELRQAVQEALDKRRKLVQVEEAAVERQVLESGSFSVDLKKHVAVRDGQPLDLTPREFKLLVYLMQNSHRVVGPKELVRVAQDFEAADLNEARDVIKWYVHHLRRKIEPDPDNPIYIVNVRGVGYRFQA
jgi:two-component system alkaline phosphatase synthesis response regulator PhoP